MDERLRRLALAAARGDAYVEVDRSRLLPDAPLAAFARFLAGPDQARAVFEFLDWLRAQDRSS